MTGPEHYAEAERLLAQAAKPGTYSAVIVARAQVHATLALTAATAPATYTWPAPGEVTR